MPYKDKADQKKHYQDNMLSYKWRNRLNKYKITKEYFYDLLEKQEGKCALCGKAFPDIFGKDILHIDHDHENDKIRGILCLPCNVGLGMLGDNVEGLTKALAYVKGELH